MLFSRLGCIRSRSLRACSSKVFMKFYSSSTSSEDVESLFEKHYSLIKQNHKEGSTFLQEVDSLPKFSNGSTFNNHQINLSKIDVYGFDFDFVLASYTPALQLLIYNLAKTIMIQEKRYPDDFMKLEYDPTFAIRGLHFDTKKGVLMKLDFVNNINVDTVYYGRKLLTPHQVLKIYPSLHLQQKYVNQNLRHICDLFQLPECTILADIIQYFEDRNIKFDPAAVYRDVRDAVTFVHYHRLNTVIRANIESYVHRKPELGELLAGLRKEGKSTFILTNNSYNNVNYLMDYIIEYLPIGYEHWVELFDAVITNADKPNFYTTTDRPFRILNAERDGLLWVPVEELKRGEVYRDGCLKEMMKRTDWSKDNVLYMGDHIQNDLVDAGRHWGWRTCAIVNELEDAITCHNSLEFRTLLSHYEQLLMLHNQMRRVVTQNSTVLTKLERHIQSLTKELMWIRHEKFGCVFKSGAKETLFAYQLLRFADLYTSKVENILQLPKNATLTPNRRLMPHDISITPHLSMM